MKALLAVIVSVMLLGCATCPPCKCECVCPSEYGQLLTPDDPNRKSYEVYDDLLPDVNINKLLSCVRVDHGDGTYSIKCSR